MLNSGRAADFVSYLLVLALEIKDKPRKSSPAVTERWIHAEPGIRGTWHV